MTCPPVTLPPVRPALHLSQANALTTALTAQILIAYGLLTADGEAPAHKRVLKDFTH
jgi:hypothetical protein